MGNVRENKQKMMMDILGARPIAFNPQLARLCGSVKAGLFLSQLLYWTNKSDEEWIFKTISEFEEETALSRKEQDSAILRLKQLGLLEVQVRGVPPKRYFRVICDKVTFQFVQKLQIDLSKTDKSIYTENTTDRFVFNKLNTNGDKSPRVDKSNPNVDRVLEVFTQVTGLRSPADKQPRQVAWNFHQKYGSENFRPALEYLSGLWNKSITKIETVKLHFPTYQRDVLKLSGKELTKEQQEIAELLKGRDA